MRGPARPLLLALLLVLGAARPGPGVAEPRAAADRQTLLRLIVEIIQELKRHHSGEPKRLQLLGARELGDPAGPPEEQRVEIVPRDLRMKDKFLKHLTGPLYFSPKCSKHFHRLYHNTRDCTIPACNCSPESQLSFNDGGGPCPWTLPGHRSPAEALEEKCFTKQARADYKRCARLLTRLAVSPMCMEG